MLKKIYITSLLLLMFAGISQAQRVYENTKMQVGEAAPDLAYPNPQGQDLALSDVAKGRYVLLDFWASWCGPCRRSNPALVKMYKEYTAKKFKNAPNGFTIFSVSLDRNQDAWLKAITADGLEWPYHISDLKAWKSEAAATYGVSFIPQTFLIGPDGKIIGKYTVKQVGDQVMDIADQVAADLDKYVVTTADKKERHPKKTSKK